MSESPLYKNPAAPTEARIEDLLGRMTLAEKIGQMCQLDGRVEPLRMVAERQPGSFLQVLAADIDPIIEANERTRLRIPILFGVDAIHGHSFWPGATIFPTQLTLAASWDPALMERMAEVTRIEMMHTGVSWTFSPVLCLPRDLRWGRVGETFGEDARLIGDFAVAMIKGYQGDDLKTGVLATAKHYAGYSETQGGRDASEADLSQRKLRAWFLPPFQRAVAAGAATFMTGYQSIEGVPSTANRWLLRDVLREEWGFDGFLVTDWDNVGRMVWEQKVCPDYADAAARAIAAGNDMSMATPKFYDGALEAAAAGRVDLSQVDAAVRRILRAKFALGLFENPRRSDPVRAAEVIGCAAHRAAALEAARRSLVLLRNEGQLLPLAAERTRVLITGPNADDGLALLGDWSLGTGQANNRNGAQHPRESIVTIKDGLEQVFAQMRYAPGCRIVAADGKTPEPGLEWIEAAVAEAAKVDVVVACVGDVFAYYGEFKSTATLELMGGQVALLEALLATGKPLVVVVQSSKPLVLPAAVIEHAQAILYAGCPGMLGGQAVAEVLAGTIEPTGRLTLSWPKHVGQQPIFYNQVRGQHGNRYADLDQSPQFAFGEGLSYTTVAYADLVALTPRVRAGEAVKLAVTVSNTGARPTIEVVQVYVSDLVTSVTWVDQTLAAYARVALAPGQVERVELTVPAEALALVDAAGASVIEPGEFELRAGPSSRAEAHLVVRFDVVA